MDVSNWRQGSWPKKYKVDVTTNGKTTTVQFGDQRFAQYRDATPLKIYKARDHLDESRRLRFLARHSKNKGLAGQLSRKYLW